MNTTATPAISHETSVKFRFWSFTAMFLLVFVHGYNLQIRYLQPWTVPGEPLSVTGFVEYFLSNGLLRFRIPMLFIISGFLYSLSDYRPYRQRTWKRFRTLFIPYLIWSAFGIIFTWLLEMFPWTRQVVATSGVVQFSPTEILLHDYPWWKILLRWILVPVPYQLWFIRVLFIYNIAYPVIRWCVTNRYARWPFFIIAFVAWFMTINVGLIEGEGLLFFSLGIWIQKRNFDIETPKRWLNPLWWGVVFVGFAAAKTVLAFIGLERFGTADYYIIGVMHKIVVLSGLIACWYGLDPVVRFFTARKWFLWLSAFAFIIYALHTPLVAYAIDPVLNLLKPFIAYRITAYVFLPLAIIAFCVGTGALLRRFVPKGYSVLTGGRGL